MKKKQMKVCICFFGLTRSLRFTYDSINKNVFQVLKDNNISYEVYLHTYDLKVLNNNRSREFNCELDLEEYKLLNPNKYVVTSQDKFDKNFDYESIKKYGDYWRDKFGSATNLIRQLNSLKEVFELIKNKKNYDSYIFIRPDLKILTEININDIIESKKKDVILTSSYDKFNGLNDKVAIGSYRSAEIFANRLDYIYEYMKCNGKLHSERHLKFVMEKFGIKNIDLNLYFVRVRADNTIERKDLKFILELRKLT